MTRNARRGKVNLLHILCTVMNKTKQGVKKLCRSSQTGVRPRIFATFMNDVCALLSIRLEKMCQYEAKMHFFPDFNTKNIRDSQIVKHWIATFSKFQLVDISFQPRDIKTSVRFLFKKAVIVNVSWMEENFNNSNVIIFQ